MTPNAGCTPGASPLHPAPGPDPFPICSQPLPRRTRCPRERSTCPSPENFFGDDEPGTISFPPCFNLLPHPRHLAPLLGRGPRLRLIKSARHTNVYSCFTATNPTLEISQGRRAGESWWVLATRRLRSEKARCREAPAEPARPGQGAGRASRPAHASLIAPAAVGTGAVEAAGLAGEGKGGCPG